MIPKIEFTYSWIYDESYRNSPRIQELLKKQNVNYPSIVKIQRYIQDVDKLWQKKGSVILEEIARITKFKWKENKTKCYIIGFGRCFTEPLTMRL